MFFRHNFYFGFYLKLKYQILNPTGQLNKGQLLVDLDQLIIKWFLHLLNLLQRFAFNRGYGLWVSFV